MQVAAAIGAGSPSFRSEPEPGPFEGAFIDRGRDPAHQCGLLIVEAHFLPGVAERARLQNDVELLLIATLNFR